MTDLTLKIARATAPYLLQNGSILATLPAKDLDWFQHACQTTYRKRGDVLFRQGGFPKGMFWLISGKAKIFQETPGGHRQTLYVYSNGDLIGYRQLIAGEVHPVSAVLLEDSLVGFVPAEAFRNLLDTSPIFARHILNALAHDFTVWMNRMTVFAQFPVRQRLALALLILHEQYRLSGSLPGVVTMTRTELAEYLGASLETVVRALNILKAANLVRISGRRMLLPDPGGLLEILQREEV